MKTWNGVPDSFVDKGRVCENMKTYKTISDYIKAAPKDSQAMLRKMHTCIRKAAPGATESIKWGMPTFSYHRILVMFAGFKHHIGFFPTASATQAFTKQLSTYKTGKGSIQFPFDQPLPVSLIAKITKYRIKESLTEDKKWRTNRTPSKKTKRE